MKKVFILGNPRSGTTLLRLMINSHPQMTCPPECGFLTWWYEKYGNWNMSFSEELTGQFVNDLKTSKKIEGWGLDFSMISEMINSRKPTDYSALTQIVYEVYAKQREKSIKIIADKNNYFINQLDLINLIWPDSYYLMIVRDGRDVACSYKNIQTLETNSPYKPKLPSSADLIAREWKENNERILGFFSNLPNEKTYVVRYEDLVSESSATLSKICDFLNVPFHNQMLEYYKFNQKHKDEPANTLDWKLKTLEKPDEKNVGKFRSELTIEEIQVFNKVAGKLLERFDYGE